jgi:hypothetical protein
MTRRILQAAAVLFFLAVSLWAADDPFVGTWKLNLAKSNPEAAATFKSGVARIEQRPGGLKTTADLVSADGMAIHTEFTAKYDGMDYPVTGDPYSDTIAIRQIDPNRAYSLWKKGGTAVATAENVISADGKTWTETLLTRNAQGTAVTIIAVYDKQ